MILRKITPLLLSVVLFCPLAAQGAGFALQEQSVRNQGASFAGAAANPGDASTIFYNPAGLTALDGAQGVAGVTLIWPHLKYDDHGSTGGLTAGAQAAYVGSEGSNPFPGKGIPNFYAATPVKDGKIWLGLGVTTPFGLANTYDRNWYGRYDSTASELTVIDVAPVIAYRVNDALSIGGGPDLQIADGKLDAALPCPAGLGCGAAFSPTTDGLSRLKGSSWHLGYNLGALYTFSPGTQVGVHYRAAVTHNLKGQATVAGLAGALAAQNGVRDASLQLKLPSSAGIAGTYALSPRLKLLGNVEWTGWDSFDEIRIKFVSGAADSTTPENYGNSWAAALGAEWKQTDALTLRTGVQYDQTPTTSPDRSTRTPDSDRYWISAGASYAVNKMFSLDVAASHLFMPSADIGLTKSLYAAGAATTVHINGTAESHVNIAGVQATLKF